MPTLFCREAAIPCRQWWEGPRQDGSPSRVPRQSTHEEIEAQRKAIVESRPGPDLHKKEAKGHFMSEKEVRRRINRGKE